MYSGVLYSQKAAGAWLLTFKISSPCFSVIYVYTVVCDAGPVFSYKLRYIVGFWLVEMAISTNQKPTISRNLYENTDPVTLMLFVEFAVPWILLRGLWPSSRALFLGKKKLIGRRNEKYRFLVRSCKQTKDPETRDGKPMWFQCWATVCDAGPTLKPHWINASCLLGKYTKTLSKYYVKCKHGQRLAIYRPLKWRQSCKCASTVILWRNRRIN